MQRIMVSESILKWNIGFKKVKSWEVFVAEGQALGGQLITHASLS
jgi:hypothetical protein